MLDFSRSVTSRYLHSGFSEARWRTSVRKFHVHGQSYIAWEHFVPVSTMSYVHLMISGFNRYREREAHSHFDGYRLRHLFVCYLPVLSPPVVRQLIEIARISHRYPVCGLILNNSSPNMINLTVTQKPAYHFAPRKMVIGGH